MGLTHNYKSEMLLMSGNIMNKLTSRNVMVNYKQLEHNMNSIYTHTKVDAPAHEQLLNMILEHTLSHKALQMYNCSGAPKELRYVLGQCMAII